MTSTHLRQTLDLGSKDYSGKKLYSKRFSNVNENTLYHDDPVQPNKVSTPNN